MTNVATYGGISRSAETWWKAKYTALSDYISLEAIQAMVGDLTDGNIRPQLIITTQDVWDDIYTILTPYQRDYSDKETAKFGYQKIVISGIPITVDAQCPSGEMYFLNFDYLKWRPLAKYANFHFTGWKDPVLQDMMTAQLIWKGNLTCSNCRYQGRIVSIST
ncbi:MAG: phage major capsid protein [Bacillota bacterium]|nr:MAG: phage major capsid protein [Bacillota bacterium]